MPKGAQKVVFGVPFRKDSEVSGESENEAPVWTPAPFSRLWAPNKAKDFDAISGRGPRKLGDYVFLRF